MKAYKYTKVEKLPKGAIKVSSYAADNSIQVGTVYMTYKRGKASYNIVNWQGINFVIPAKIKQ